MNSFDKTKQIIEGRIQALYKESRKSISKLVQKIPEDFIKVSKAKENLVDKYLNEILSIKHNDQRRSFYIPLDFQSIAPQYLRRLLITLKDIQFSRKYYRHYKMKEFLKTYQNIWKTEIPKPDKEMKKVE